MMNQFLLVARVSTLSLARQIPTVLKRGGQAKIPSFDDAGTGVFGLSGGKLERFRGTPSPKEAGLVACRHENESGAQYAGLSGRGDSTKTKNSVIKQ